ncbi:MAG: transcriptional repressor NrdR [Alphaproteobacteria bacterium]|nr:transcriptional repressor NrdR [Alphaproteobacteria bacterium]MCB9763238.1 transcriptional repressor NrdR [Alphaproteobacteria bacterium]
MICPYCEHDGSKVVDSRTLGESIRRRRECEGCARRFTTHERIERRLPAVVKKSGVREAFDRDKLRQGLDVACRKRAVSSERLDQAAALIERRVLHEAEKGEIASVRLGALVLEELLLIDRVAYLRFASVYQELASPEQFLELLQPLLGGEDG